MKKIENVDLNFGGSGVNQKLTTGYSDPENPYNDGLKKKKISEITNI